MRLTFTLLAAAAAGLVASWAAAEQHQSTARATLHAPDGSERGSATFSQTPNGVLVTAELHGLPEGEHGFHIHTTGACAPDFSAAGGHFAGDADAHGFKVGEGPHAGDLPNIHVPASGELTLEVYDPRVTLAGGENPLLDSDGSALIVHAGADDYESQPSGDAGDRIACGVIEAVTE